MTDQCETATSCPVDPEENQLEVEDPSILQETQAGPVKAEPLVVSGTLTQAISYLNLLLLGPTAQAGPAAQEDDTRIQGYVEHDYSLLNVSEYTSRQVNPLLVSYTIMNFVEQNIKLKLHRIFDEMVTKLHIELLSNVPDLADGGHKGFVGINKSGFLSKYTTVIYYAGRILYETNPIFSLMERW